MITIFVKHFHLFEKQIIFFTLKCRNQNQSWQNNTDPKNCQYFWQIYPEIITLIPGMDAMITIFDFGSNVGLKFNSFSWKINKKILMLQNDVFAYLRICLWFCPHWYDFITLIPGRSTCTAHNFSSSTSVTWYLF
jgi:hypothetical protein